MSMLTYFFLALAYPIFLEWRWQGQTIGKRIMGLQVVDEAGLRLTFSQVAVRNLLRIVDSMPGFYLVGGVSMVLNTKSQRLGDLAANTIVIRHTQVHEPDLDQVMAGKFHSFRDHPHLAGRLRQLVSPQEAGVALQALLRRNELEEGIWMIS